ncbi:related to retrotransposon HobS hobase (N-terminal fragment) [Serendipita indica DSM 11827]|uniref:Related to retrotransposon HobS hobase (N-terminal) n=1 Tax=Serendipita indica (strain DSM 11827) TaxID=1109443 RepID=G4TZK9_SERID|nr:related to retrotransposon HobS hobase (N-terminal fragment) [Serendipita indica DSM 11827]
MAMVDDASNLVTLSLLHLKDGALKAFCEFHKLAENQTGQRLVHLRDDKGGEFSGKEFEQYCISAGITRERTIVATPEQNGRVERANRWIAEGTIAKLTEANLPPSFWGSQWKTPYEHWHGKAPSVDHLRVFGCLAYVVIPKSQRTALDSQTEKCIFVGYPSDRPGWVFWNPQTRKIIHSDSAVFDERVFPGTSSAKESTPNLSDYIQLPDLEEIDTPSSSIPPPNTHSPVHVAGRPVPAPIPHEPVPPPAPAPAQPKPTAPQCLSCELRALTDQTNFEKVPRNLPARRHTVAPALNTSTSREPTTLGEALKCPDSDKYVQAAIEEVRAHLENGTWKLVRLPQGKKAIGSRWVFKIKRDADGSISKYKGRITFAPTARFGALRTIIALAALEDWELESVDISTAFLNGEIDAEVYMRKPEGVEFEGYEGTSWVLQLLKGLYGIKQGPRIWSRPQCLHL